MTDQEYLNIIEEIRTEPAVHGLDREAAIVATMMKSFRPSAVPGDDDMDSQDIIRELEPVSFVPDDVVSLTMIKLGYELTDYEHTWRWMMRRVSGKSTPPPQLREME